MDALLQNKRRFDLNKRYPKECAVLSHKEMIKLFQEKEKLEKEKKFREAEQIKKKIVESNIRLVHWLARSMFFSCPVGDMTFQDLVQEGSLGLMKAVDCYDWKKGFRFSSYAIYRIRQSIARGIGNKSQVIRVPVSMRDKVMQYNRAQKQMCFLLGHSPTNKEMQEALGLKEKQLRAIEKAIEGISSKNVFSFDVDFYFHNPDNDGRQRDRERLLETEPKSELSAELSSVFETVERKLINEKLKEILNCLAPREKFIILARFGFLDEDWTLQKVGDKLHLTRERVRQIQNQALKKIRCFFIAQGFQEYFLNNGRY